MQLATTIPVYEPEGKGVELPPPCVATLVAENQVVPATVKAYCLVFAAGVVLAA